MLLIQNEKIEANLPQDYKIENFDLDLQFALHNAASNRSPVQQEINFLKEFTRLYENSKGQVAETKSVEGEVSESEVSQNQETLTESNETKESLLDRYLKGKNASPEKEIQGSS